MNNTTLNCKLLFYVIKFYKVLITVYLKINFVVILNNETFRLNTCSLLMANLLLLSVNNWQNIVWHCPHRIILLTSYDTAHIVWYCSHRMILLTSYDTAHIVWYCSHRMILLASYNTAHIVWYCSHRMILLDTAHIVWYCSHLLSLQLLFFKLGKEI